ncbi:NLI interacting factor-like phosphatase (macronuclear) [Tetrahymena thermophila SB210]|uniref:NLI interacting factor-like phosphatase n=1 Tax=Tetrahymena thermophila (strain SB210) TaxID=312017 RepID=Q23KI9_TETTS|nr:NLI interacting factor-like phosphatase [Tetrahymena thermophila SB210]EAR96854.2 NLI interacting factor-like phosphatase [Tetrahymena thermophila SB210]|eukprot:XP_001017099.2 NLI interacting factor-like phosphatase [Tetrahymena thermophila SB210]
MVPITSFIFQEGNKSLRSDLVQDSKISRVFSPKKTSRQLNDNYNMYDQNGHKKQFAVNEQRQNFQAGKSLDRNLKPLGQSNRKNNNSQNQNGQNQQTVLRQYELNYQRLLKYKQFLEEKAREEIERQNDVQNVIVVNKKNPEERFEIPPRYIQISRERSEDRRYNQMNDSQYMNSSLKQSKYQNQYTSPRIQSPKSPYKRHLELSQQMPTQRGLSSLDNRKTPPYTYRQNVQKVMVQAQQSKTLEEDVNVVQSNYSTKLNQLMPKIAPKKMIEELSSSSPSNNNNQFRQTNSSKKYYQTQNFEFVMEESLNTTTIHGTKQINKINIFNNQISKTFYKPKQQIQLDNFMKDMQEQSLGLKKTDLLFDNNNQSSKNKSLIQNRTPSNQYQNESKGEVIKSFKSATPNNLEASNRQNIRVSQINRVGLRELVRPYARPPNIVYDQSELLSLSRNQSPDDFSQQQYQKINGQNNQFNMKNEKAIEESKIVQQNQNGELQNDKLISQNIQNQITNNTNNYPLESHQKVNTNSNNNNQNNNNQSSLQTSGHVFSEKQFNLQIRESKIPLLKNLLNSDGAFIQTPVTPFGNNEVYDAQYHEKKMEYNLKQNLIINQDQKNGLIISNMQDGERKINNLKIKSKENRFNYGILEIGSLSTNFDIAIQNVKMESLFMVEEYTFDVLKFIKENFKVRKICKLYLKNTNDNNYKIIEGIFKDKKILLNYKRMIIFERIVILTLILFSYTPQQPMPLDIQVLLKNLCYYIHNNATLLIELLLDIFTQTKNLHPNWEKLTEIFHLRLKKQNTADKNEIVDLIIQNNSQIETLFTQLKQKYNYEFMLHISKYKDEALQVDNLADSLNMLQVKSQEILTTVNETKKSQQKTDYIKQDDEENQNNFNNIEDYIKYEQKNKIIYSNDYQIDDDEEGEEEDDSEEEEQYQSSIASQSSSGKIEKERTEKDSQNEQNSKEKKKTKSQSQRKGTSVKEPYLPPINTKYKYTLVLDLDETLVHYHEMEDQTGGEFLIRPFAEQFLYDMSKYYEIVIFTAAVKEYADWILDIIDKDKNISYKLYRQHTVFDGQYNLKDLSKLGRNISKTIIIDNLPENFSKQPENGIFIQSWFGEKDDKALFDLSPLLRQIVEKESPDVRIALRKFSDQIEENMRNGIQYPHLNLIL